MKRIVIGILVLGSFPALAGEVKTKCGKPSIIIDGVVSKRSIADKSKYQYGVHEKTELNGKVLIDNEEVGASTTDRSLDILVAQTAISEGLELCETVNIKRYSAERTLYVKR